MAIHFSKDRMEEVSKAYELWWEGKLDRPLINGYIRDAYGTVDTPFSPMVCYDFSISPEAVIDCIDAQMSCCEFVGDGYPLVNMDQFGPGVLAALCGAKYRYDQKTVWFYPEKEVELAELHPVYDPNHPLAQRIKAIYKAGMERWNGKVLMGMLDLGGVLDVLAGLYGTDNLLFALVDEPEQIERLAGEIQTAWYAAYEDMAEVMKPQQYYADWSGLMSKTPAYVLQCDFCYMISNAMFRRFVLNTLTEDTRRLSRTLYHLDGEGELTHLEDILSIEGLTAVQWVPIKQTAEEELAVCRKIVASGKRLQLCETKEDIFQTLVSTVCASPYRRCPGTMKDREAIMKVIQTRGLL